MPSLKFRRYAHACCVLRGRVVVLGGYVWQAEYNDNKTVRVEISGGHVKENVDKILPPLSCDFIYGSTAVMIDESRATKVRCFSSVDGTMLEHHPQCTRWTWHLGRALRNPLSFALEGMSSSIVWLGACQTGASFVLGPPTKTSHARRASGTIPKNIPRRILR
jgi:hypothetical protein